jgi:hypothetical protein
MSISPDADVTSCAAYIVRRFAPERHAGAVDAILLSNQTVRGWFKTWLRALHEPNDVSPCVNANVLLYLGDHPETHRAAHYLLRVLERRDAAGSDWYYADPNALYYMISRACVEGTASLSPCTGLIRAAVDEASTETPLSVALALCALGHVGAGTSDRASELSQRLIDAQADDGGWPAAAFYAGPEPPEAHRFWWGSRALTTAICVEALARRSSPGLPGTET